MDQDHAIAPGTGPRVACNLCGSDRATRLFRKFGYDLVRCEDCGLAYVANPPDHAAVEAFYSAQAHYHEEVLDPDGPAFAAMRRTARQHMRFLRRSVPDADRRRLLDIGCSAGLFLDEARAAGFDVQGAELCLDTAAFARRQFGVIVHEGDWRRAGYEREYFDVITMFDVIEHLPDPLGEMRDLQRLLKPGGLLLMSTPDIDGLFPRVSRLLADRLDYWPHPEPPHHLFQFSRRTLSDMAEKAGFEIVRADRTSIRPSYNFGSPVHWRRSPKMIAYAAAFAPVALAGHALGMGDWLYLAVRKPG